MAGVVSRVETLVAPIVQQLGYDLVEVEFTKEGKNHMLTLYIDKRDGVGIDD